VDCRASRHARGPPNASAQLAAADPGNKHYRARFSCPRTSDLIEVVDSIQAITLMAGPKGRHDATRTAVRHGRECGSVTLGGRRVPVTRPRVRAADGSAELPVASYDSPPLR
jgi:hypothetical protein